MISEEFWALRPGFGSDQNTRIRNPGLQCFIQFLSSNIVSYIILYTTHSVYLFSILYWTVDVVAREGRLGKPQKSSSTSGPTFYGLLCQILQQTC